MEHLFFTCCICHARTKMDVQLTTLPVYIAIMSVPDCCKPCIGPMRRTPAQTGEWERKQWGKTESRKWKLFTWDWRRKHLMLPMMTGWRRTMLHTLVYIPPLSVRQGVKFGVSLTEPPLAARAPTWLASARVPPLPTTDTKESHQ